MAKGRVRLRGAKGKRWQKGQSGSSNPSDTRHRQAARGKFGDHLSRGRSATTGASLTAEALVSHDAKQEEPLTLDRDGDVRILEEGEEGSSHSNRASTSVASSSAFTLIETAHPVFGRIRKLWNSPTETHRIICAVLAAVSDVVKSSGGRDSETEYFGALVTALESAEEEKAVAAISYLLTLILPSVPYEVLQLRFGTACKTIVGQLSRHQGSDSTALLKSLVRVLALLLEVVEAATWTDSYTLKVYQLVLNFTTHPKPKLRKVAQSSVISTLRGGTPSGHFHPTAPLTASHCQRIMEEREGSETTVLHVLVMLKDCLANFPTPQLKSLCETILKLMALGSRMVRTTCLLSLHGLFSSLAGPQGLTAQLAARLISALYDQHPSLQDSQLLCAWLAVMQAAHTKLASLDQELCMAHLVQFLSACVSCFLSHSTVVTETAATVIQDLLKDVLRSYLQSMDNVSMVTCPSFQVVQRAYHAVERGLEYKYQRCWGLVLKSVCVFVRLAGQPCSVIIAKSLPSLSSLHSTPDFPFRSELEEVFATAIETMGPKTVLDHVPLQLDTERSSVAFPRSWLLPLLRDHVSHTQLAYFTEHILPLAGRMKSRAEGHCNAGRHLESKLYDTLQHQLWSLLPGFCRQPTDISVSFPSLARILGTALSKREELRTVVASALRQLVEGSREDDKDRQVLARYSKNYLPILFNLYSTTPTSEGVGPALLQCVGAYVSITEQPLVDGLFDKAVEKGKQEDIAKETRYQLLDLVRVLIARLTAASLQTVLDTVSPLLDNPDPPLQKRAYRCLEELLSSSGPAHLSFVQDHLQLLTSALSDSLSTSSTASKKPRLKCLVQLVDHLGPDNTDFLETTIPEVMLCTKEVNEKCRELALQLLTVAGNAVQRCYGLSAEESVVRYLQVIVAGLAGSAHMVSATLISLSKLVCEFHDVFGSNTVSQLLSAGCKLLSSRSREVVKAAFNFIKVTIRVLPPSELTPHLEELLERVLNWSSQPKSHFRLRARVIVERLIRKFSYEMVSSMAPQQHQKLMVHIHKTTQREKRRKLASREGKEEQVRDRMRLRKHRSMSLEDLLCDSSEEESVLQGTPPTATGRGRKTHRRQNRTNSTTTGTTGGATGGGGSWIREASGEEPVNFLDSSIARRVVTTRPGRTRRTVPSHVLTTAVGKLVISEEEQGVSQAPEVGIETSGGSRKKRKHKEEEEEGERGGGRGIHRKNPEFDYGAEYRAKRARGDMKVKGRPDPYVYVPLMGQKLNRRKRAKLAGQFKGVLKKAKSGSATGSKQRRR